MQISVNEGIIHVCSDEIILLRKIAECDFGLCPKKDLNERELIYAYELIKKKLLYGDDKGKLTKNTETIFITPLGESVLEQFVLEENQRSVDEKQRMIAEEQRLIDNEHARISSIHKIVVIVLSLAAAVFSYMNYWYTILG